MRSLLCKTPALAIRKSLTWTQCGTMGSMCYSKITIDHNLELGQTMKQLISSCYSIQQYLCIELKTFASRLLVVSIWQLRKWHCTNHPLHFWSIQSCYIGVARSMTREKGQLRNAQIILGIARWNS